MKGRAIYTPKGKAGEYAKYACNFYVGCSNDCDYCYCKRGVLAHAMGKPQATLKKCFKDKEHAMRIFTKEVMRNYDELRECGLFFTFTSDPMLKDCIELTKRAVNFAILSGICCTILTKRADFIDDIHCWTDNLKFLSPEITRNRIAFGFTLTGHDELERGASTNAERIECMEKLHSIGFKTFASIEPIVDLGSSLDMIKKTIHCCDLYKIGLMSGKRNYTPQEVRDFLSDINVLFVGNNLKNKVYLKDSVLNYVDVERSSLENKIGGIYIYVTADYNMFN